MVSTSKQILSIHINADRMFTFDTDTKRRKFLRSVFDITEM